MPSQPELPQATRDAMRWRVQKWIAERVPNMSELAREISAKVAPLSISDQALGIVLKKDEPPKPGKKSSRPGRHALTVLEQFFGEKAEDWIKAMRAEQAGSAQPTPTESDLESANDDGRGQRWTERDERYPPMTQVFARARAAKVSEHLIIAARARLSVFKDAVGPTEREVEAALEAEISASEKLAARILRGSSEVTDEDLAPPQRKGRAR